MDKNSIPSLKLEPVWEDIKHPEKITSVANAYGVFQAESIVSVNENSAYPEVRAAVPNTDDPSTPHNTIRMWVLGMVMCTVGSALNTFFSFHSPAFNISTFVSSILAWPLGRLWDLLPNYMIFGVPLNPGPFNVKEHTLITIMANVSFGGGAAYATDIIIAMNNFYGIDFGWGFGMVACVSTQLIGYSYAGLTRSVLVYPGQMIWPSNLVSTTFLTNIHMNSNTPANGWNISKLRFFTYICIGSFIWYWIPGYMAQFLSYFSFVTWIKPNNVIINQIFGAQTGLGILPITFDWNQVAGYVGSPLIPPISTIATIFTSMVCFFWIITPIIHYSKTFYSEYLPISDSGSYDRYQKTYNVSRILTKDFSFDLEGYKNYSPLFLSTTFSLSYGLSFASITATIVHAALFHGKEIYELGWKNRNKNTNPDIHNKLMTAYTEVPHWWFLIIFLISFGLAIATITAWNVEMPVWALIIALIIALVFIFPIGIIMALTNIQVGLNVVTEFIAGYLMPGKPFAMMFFKTFGYITNFQGTVFSQDMKLGHYMKIAPRTLFWAQGIAVVWGAIVQIAAMKWTQNHIPNVCSPDQKSHFTCPNGRVFFNASIIWGVIGPQRQFSPGNLYYPMLFFFIIGAVLPIISWLILKKYPNCFLKSFFWPVFLNGTAMIPPATPYNYGAYCIVGTVFGFFIKRKWFDWWSKYNYSL